MVQERAEVDPGTALLENPVDNLDELNDVVSTVDEDTGDDTVMAGHIFRVEYTSRKTPVAILNLASSGRVLGSRLGILISLSWSLLERLLENWWM